MAAQVQGLTKRREWEDRPLQESGEPFQKRQTVVFRIIVLENLCGGHTIFKLGDMIPF